MSKIKMKLNFFDTSFKKAFKEFIIAKTAEGI